MANDVNIFSKEKEINEIDKNSNVEGIEKTSAAQDHKNNSNESIKASNTSKSKQLPANALYVPPNRRDPNSNRNTSSVADDPTYRNSKSSSRDGRCSNVRPEDKTRLYKYNNYYPGCIR